MSDYISWMSSNVFVGVGDAAAVVHFGAEAFVGVNEVGFLPVDGFPQASAEGVVVVVGNHGLGVVFDLGFAVFQVVDIVLLTPAG